MKCRIGSPAARQARRAVRQVALVLLLADRQAEVGPRAEAMHALAALRREQGDDVVAGRDRHHALADRSTTPAPSCPRTVGAYPDGSTPGGGVHVGVAHAAGDEPDQHLASPGIGQLELADDERAAELLQYGGANLHVGCPVLPLALPCGALTLLGSVAATVWENRVMRRTSERDRTDRRGGAPRVGRAAGMLWRIGLALALVTLAGCGSAQGKPDTSSAAQTSLRTASAVSSTAQSRTISSTPPSKPATPCGSAAGETLARTEGLVATRIYANELSSSEVSADKSQVEHYQPLLSALQSNNRAGVAAAVTSLVYSHTHVVRLRVSRGGVVLSDVGGPYIIAPVGGTLRVGGQVVGHYILSVQDDLGYVKLVSRFIGVPLVLRQGPRSVPVEGTSSGPATIPDHGPVSYRHVSYQAFSINAKSFPMGALRISLLVPVSSSLGRRSCAEIRVAELGDVARRVSHRFTLSPANFSSYVRATAPLTGGLIYIRSGSRQLAGSTQPGPHTLPDRGTVVYRGKNYGVFSFTAGSEVGPVRISAARADVAAQRFRTKRARSR